MSEPRARPTKQPGESVQAFNQRVKLWQREQNLAEWSERNATVDRRDLLGEARDLVGTDPSEALARLVARLLAVRGPAEAAALRVVITALGVARGADGLDAEDRRWAAMTPEERAEETLRDPVHGPLIEALVKRRLEQSK